MSTSITHWGEVSYKIQPDDDGSIHLMLDGQEYTFECHLHQLSALRLGQGLVKLARLMGLPSGTVDP